MPNLTSLSTNFFATPNEGFTTTTSGPVDSSSATVIPFNSVSGLTNGSIYTGLIDPGNAKERAFTGVVDTAGSQITSVVFTTGTNATHTTGATIVDYVTGTHVGATSKGILVHADQDGTLKAGAVDVTAVLANGVVTTAKLADASVTPNKLALSPQQAIVSTNQTTTSTSFTDLSTVGPQVTVTIGANGLALVSVYGRITNNTSTGQAHISFEMSGANTLAAGADYQIGQTFTSNYELWTGSTFLLTGLNPGSTTFTLKYRAVTAGTASFNNRRIAVVPL